MPRNLFALLIALLLAGSVVFAAEPPAPFRIDDTSVAIVFRNGEAFARLTPPSIAGREVRTRARLEVLSPSGVVVASVGKDVTFASGNRSADVALPLDLARLDAQTKSQLPWYRLRYSLTPGGTGTVSLSAASPDLFDLQLVAPNAIRRGGRIETRVRAVRPGARSGLPAVRVHVEAEFDVGDDERKLRANAVTDGAGYAVVHFQLPKNITDDDVELEVSAERNGFTLETSESVDIDESGRLIVSTDKGLFQPGQTLHMRVLAFDRFRQAIADAPVSIEIKDQEYDTAFTVEARTSRFGVASADWAIPESTPLGYYYVDADIDEGPYEDAEDLAAVIRISRYELPNFAVTTKADRSYYLPGQNSQVEIRADYLFGKPVTSGHVRLVPEKDRHWDFEEQKWEVDEGTPIEGEIGKDGSFQADVDLSETHKEIADEGYTRFKDLEYAAYVTDASTGRTEQRRFALRATKEAIHMYVLEEEGRVGGLPTRAYVVASYADGTPAECDVIARESGGEGVVRQLAPVHTNRFGVTELALAPVAHPEVSRYAGLDLQARDTAGHTGSYSDTLWRANEDETIYVDTDKSLYRVGEPIRVRLTSSVPDAVAFVDVMSGPTLLTSMRVRLRDGVKEFTLPYQPSFQDEIAINASFPYQGASSRDYPTAAARAVVFPASADLEVDVRTDRREYRPGDEARVNIAVRTADGALAESVLGVTAMDTAVLERERTDQDFSGQASERARFWSAFWWKPDAELSGIKRSDLSRLDASKRFPADLDLVAKVLLRSTTAPEVKYLRGEFDGDVESAFGDVLAASVRRAKAALDDLYLRSESYPNDERSLRSALLGAGIDLDAIRDPWGEPVRPEFAVDKQYDILRLRTTGPDKQFGTWDDFSTAIAQRVYFRSTGVRIDKAVADYHARTGEYVRDASALAEAIGANGLAPSVLLDRWGRPYRTEFVVNGTNFVVRLLSNGADGREESLDSWESDDFMAWTTRENYTKEWASRVDEALARHKAETGKYPDSEPDVRTALTAAGINPSGLLDPWGHPYIVLMRELTQTVAESHVVIRMKDDVASAPANETTLVPQTVRVVVFSSAGPDGVARNDDDFTAAAFSGAVLSTETKPSTRGKIPGGSGAIQGIVTDSNGASIPNVAVTATHGASGVTFATVTDSNGQYLFTNLPSGIYTLRFDASGFKTSVVEGLDVRAASARSFDMTLEVGSVSETVSVTSGEENVQTSMSSQTSSTTIATPRLREYFPETLVWEPSLETGPDGRARLAFKMADSITTWKLSVVASTADGRLGMAERDIRAFQPFFVEHDPPRVLTVGDEIALPVVLRNYLDGPQRVDLSMQPASWFTMLGADKTRAEVESGEPSRQVFKFRATAAVDDGKQRVTALGRRASDAIEKPVDVHPDGQGVSATAGQVLGEAGTLAIDVPEYAIPGSLKAELKLYPSLMDHVVEGVEAVMERPYGCGEQTISSTYPSLIVLRAYERMGKSDVAIAKKARRYFELGYKRLLGYRESGGGFSYWSDGDPNVALTAYALRFLSDARSVGKVDDEVVEGARRWLLQQQRADGGWSNDAKTSDRMLTAYVAASLAATVPGDAASAPNRDALRRALDSLARPGADDPYALAAYLLATQTADATAAGRLAALAKDGPNGMHWAPASDTPFHGWGRAGEVETTALAVRALLRAGGHDDLVRRATYFLIRIKDGYGVWYSTQATVAALEALEAVSKSTPAASGGSGRAEVLVDGRAVSSVALSDRTTGPIFLDLSPYVAPGRVEVEVRAGAASLAAQLVASWYVPWENKSADSDALSFDVRYDRTEAAAGEPVVCRVDAGRTKVGSYGMLLAEIGLPPRAEVDRESLQRAMETDGWSLDRYDVLPDRVIAYLWPYWGKSAHFEFTFRVRYGISAKTAPSVVYDYYNPDARRVVAPVRFVVR